MNIPYNQDIYAYVVPGGEITLTVGCRTELMRPQSAHGGRPASMRWAGTAGAASTGSIWNSPAAAATANGSASPSTATKRKRRATGTERATQAGCLSPVLSGTTQRMRVLQPPRRE
jgi:hypothetical protein